MFVLYHNENTLYVTGGIDQELKHISKRAFILNPEQAKCEPLPDMTQVRYAHFGTQFKNRLYIFGGRQFGKNEGAILKQCEYFDFDTWRWNMITPMIKRRCSGFVLDFMDDLYVFGGYSGNKNRCEIIEKYCVYEN